MRPHIIRSMAAAALLALAFALPAHAGRECAPRRLTAGTLERGMALAQRTHAALEAQHARDGTRVVVLARAGQDLTRFGLRYSHLGIAYRTRSADGEPAWRIVHKLNHCGSADAAVYRQGLAEFFLDDLWQPEGAWVPLAAAVQAKLLPLLENDAQVAALHQRRYSVVSYAWGQRYQQSNQWAIETLALAMDAPAVASRAQAQRWLAANRYQPGVVHIGALERLGARVGAANVAFDDHPDAQRFAGRIETVTVESVFDWLARSGLGRAPVVTRAE